MPNEASTERVDLSILIPVYNNSATLDELLDRLFAVLEPLGWNFEIICVDDGSRDESLAILQRRAAADRRIRVFALSRNFGSQAASCAACDQARGQWLIHIDADLENYPEDIPRFIDHLKQGYDLVGGVREQRHDAWLTRRLPSLLMNWYVRRRTGIEIRDVGCGLRAIDARLLRDLPMAGEARRLLTPFFLQRAQKVIEIPVRHRPKANEGGHSFMSLLGIAVDYYLVTARRPFLVSALVSFAAIGLGLLSLPFSSSPAEIVLLMVLGIAGAAISLAGEHLQHSYQLVQGIPFYQLRDLDAERQAAAARAELP